MHKCILYSLGPWRRSRAAAASSAGASINSIRPLFILRIVRPRIFESKFRSHSAKKLDGALRKSTFV